VEARPVAALLVLRDRLVTATEMPLARNVPKEHGVLLEVFAPLVLPALHLLQLVHHRILVRLVIRATIPHLRDKQVVRHVHLERSVAPRPSLALPALHQLTALVQRELVLHVHLVTMPMVAMGMVALLALLAVLLRTL